MQKTTFNGKAFLILPCLITYLSFISCISSNSGNSLPGIALSEEGKRQKQIEDQLKSSFNPNDLSGCWAEVGLIGGSGTSPAIKLKKVGTNQYTGSNEFIKLATLTVEGEQVTYQTDDFTRKGKTSFGKDSFLIVFEATANEFEINQRGLKWSSCP